MFTTEVLDYLSLQTRKVHGNHERSLLLCNENEIVEISVVARKAKTPLLYVFNYFYLFYLFCYMCFMFRRHYCLPTANIAKKMHLGIFLCTHGRHFFFSLVLCVAPAGAHWLLDCCWCAAGLP